MSRRLRFIPRHRLAILVSVVLVLLAACGTVNDGAAPAGSSAQNAQPQEPIDIGVTAR